MLRQILTMISLGAFLFACSSETTPTQRAGAGGLVPARPQPDRMEPLPIVDPELPENAARPINSLPEVAECYKSVQEICDIERAVAEQTNEYRGAQRGALVLETRLSYAARLWSEEQARRGRIGHQGFPQQRMQILKSPDFAAMSRLSMSSENVAMSSMSSNDPRAAAAVLTKMWWNSRGHRVNMLGNHKLIGVGIAKKGRMIYGTQIFGK